MAATIEIHEMTATQTGLRRDGDKVRFYSADITATGSGGNPVVIPTVASDWSYTKQIRFYMGAQGPSNFVASLKVYSDGSLWSGGAEAALVQYDKGDISSWNANVDTNINGVNIETATAANTASMSPGDSTYDDTKVTMYFGGMLRLQLEVGNIASPGTLAQETITFQYDEQ